MRLGLSLGYRWHDDDPGHVRLAREAEQLGFSVVWAAEAYGSDAVTILTWVAAHTATIDIGSAVWQIPARTPAGTAMTAATLDTLSGGRFRLGLGVSGPQVSEGWHGVRFDRPLARTREYVEIVRLTLSGRTVRHEGEHWTLPLPGGPGKALRLAFHPVRDRIPVYLAAVGPRNLELCGELADGWLSAFYAPDHAGESLARIAAGRARAGRSMDGFDVVATVPVSPGEDLAGCAAPLRPETALYIGGMGSRDHNFYSALAARMGYGEAAARVQDHYLAGRTGDAAASVPFEFIDRTSLLGTRERMAERMTELAESGVTTLSVSLHQETHEARVAALRQVVAATDLAGVA